MKYYLVFIGKFFLYGDFSLEINHLNEIFSKEFILFNQDYKYNNK